MIVFVCLTLVFNMKQYLRLFALVAILTVVTPTKRAKPNPITIEFAELIEGKLRAQLPATPDCNIKIPTGYSKCSDDCKSRVFCENGEKVKQVPCPDEAPFCDSKTVRCSSKLTNCEIREHCLGPKYYQDLTNCKKFTYCDGTYSYSYRCLGSFTWDPETESCRELACFSFANGRGGLCNGKEDQNVPYPANLNKYIYCGPNNTPVMLSCGVNQIYNGLAQACQFSCPGIGKYPDPNGINGYYECTKHDKLNIVYTNYVECGDQYYDTKEQICKTSEPKL